jgi:hypothetical protein
MASNIRLRGQPRRISHAPNGRLLHRDLALVSLRRCPSERRASYPLDCPRLGCPARCLAAGAGRGDRALREAEGDIKHVFGFASATAEHLEGLLRSRHDPVSFGFTLEDQRIICPEEDLNLHALASTRP